MKVLCCGVLGLDGYLIFCTWMLKKNTVDDGVEIVKHCS